MACSLAISACVAATNIVAPVFRSAMIVVRVASVKNGFMTGIVNGCPKVPDGAIWNADSLAENEARA